MSPRFRQTIVVLPKMETNHGSEVTKLLQAGLPEGHDNPLAEARLHGLNEGAEIFFHEDHILAVHNIHRQELVVGMDEADLKELTQWLAEYHRSKQE